MTTSGSHSSATNLEYTADQSKSNIGAVLKSLQGMGDIEALIRSRLTSDAPLLREIPSYLLELGGKRIRPALCLLVAKLCGMKTPSPELIQVSAGIELIHMATLLHDDIIDRSPLRRGKPSPHLEYGETATLLAGDFLLVRAFALCAKLDSFIISETEEACVKLTEGEVLEQPLADQPTDIAGSLDIAEKKTAALFGLGAVCGAHLCFPEMNLTSEDEEKIESIMKSFGLEVGIAFQILDDILDVTADENLLGKKCGGDLVERKPSIINVLWLQSGAPVAKDILLRNDEALDESVLNDALATLRNDSDGVIKQAQQLAVTRIERAKERLSEFISMLPNHDPQALGYLEALLEYTLKRLL